jgi:hypothetical protein
VPICARTHTLTHTHTHIHTHTHAHTHTHTHTHKQTQTHTQTHRDAVGVPRTVGRPLATLLAHGCVDLCWHTQQPSGKSANKFLISLMVSVLWVGWRYYSCTRLCRPLLSYSTA